VFILETPKGSGKIKDPIAACKTLIRDVGKNKLVYLMLLPVLAFYIIFHYIPMGGLVIAFQDFVPHRGISGSSWVGFRYFIEFFESMFFFRLMRNTFLLNVYDILIGFPLPIILALMLNELTSKRFKGSIQTALYIPHFVSLIVLCGIILDFTTTEGVINDILVLFGFERSNLMLNPGLFRPIFITSNLWQFAGWSSIIYVAALAGVNQELYDAAEVDGCGRFGRIRHVTLPGIQPIILIMLILRLGNIMTVGFEKVILLYNPLTYETADVIASYVYRRGILEANFSFATAVGLFNSAMNFAFLLFANWTSRRATNESLW